MFVLQGTVVIFRDLHTVVQEYCSDSVFMPIIEHRQCTYSTIPVIEHCQCTVPMAVIELHRIAVLPVIELEANVVPMTFIESHIIYIKCLRCVSVRKFVTLLFFANQVEESCPI